MNILEIIKELKHNVTVPNVSPDDITLIIIGDIDEFDREVEVVNVDCKTPKVEGQWIFLQHKHKGKLSNGVPLNVYTYEPITEDPEFVKNYREWLINKSYKNRSYFERVFFNYGNELMCFDRFINKDSDAHSKELQIAICKLNIKVTDINLLTNYDGRDVDLDKQLGEIDYVFSMMYLPLSPSNNWAREVREVEDWTIVDKVYVNLPPLGEVTLRELMGHSKGPHKYLYLTVKEYLKNSNELNRLLEEQQKETV